MFVKNYKELATTKERRDALKIFEAGLNAVRTDVAVRNNLKLKKNILRIGARNYDLKKYDHVYVVGFGKASFTAAKEIERILGSRITSGIILDVVPGKLKRMRTLVGTHPLPSIKNVRAAGEIIELLEKADSRDLIITIVSGGGSALLCRPYGMKCGELALVTKMLMHHGAEIREMNTVRKHLSEILGGQFARFAYPATVAAIIFSDVPGDDISMIASGPTVLDETTVDDAARILSKYDIIKSCALPGCDLTETPKDPVFFRRVKNNLIVSNSLAVEAMAKEAKRLGYKARILSTGLQGEAREIGKNLAAMPAAGEAIIAGGETTVTVTGHGKGGRNQELALGAVNHVLPGILVASYASDGNDNCPAAGAFADVGVSELAARKKLSVAEYLQNNDSFSFAKKTKSQIMTGKTGINVSDLMLALRKK